MKKLLIILFSILSIELNAQLNVYTNNTLIIEHGDITLYLDKDTCTLVSKHIIKYSDFLKLDHDRDNRWFQDKFKGNYKKEYFVNSGYDLGHLTPSHITSYNDSLNHNSFSLFNEAPQVPGFNRGKWAKLEGSVEDIISEYKKDALIITGVIYNEKNVNYLPKSRIKIPISYFKILIIDDKRYYWIGSNINVEIIPTTLNNLNDIFKINKMCLLIK